MHVSVYHIEKINPYDFGGQRCRSLADDGIGWGILCSDVAIIADNRLSIAKRLRLR